MFAGNYFSYNGVNSEQYELQMGVQIMRETFVTAL